MDPYPDGAKDQYIGSRNYSAWQLIKIYWQSNQRYPAYLFFTIVVVLTVSLVGIDVILNYWYNYFYNALQMYDRHGAIRLLLVFFTIASFNVVFQVYRFYVAQLFSLRWRKWLTEQLIGRWLRKRGYYLLENFDEKTDNPDQRIQEDVGALINYSLDLSMGLIAAFTTFFAFIYILWQLSGELTIPLGSFGNLHISGYLVWVGILYALIGTFFTFKLGRPLIPLNFEQQRREATFRYAAVDLRTHAEHVALYHSENYEKGILHRLFNRVLNNWYMIIMRQKILLWFTASYNQASVALPLLVALPNYFDKVFLLGGLIQSVRAFTTVQESLSYLVNSYTNIAQWKAVANRLTTFVNHMEEAEENAEKQNHIVRENLPENKIILKEVEVRTPKCDILLQHINETLVHGEHYLIKGDSGVGKSTFIRTLAGIWPYATGYIGLPAQKHLMYLPQKPYMPIGTLYEAIYFPLQAAKVKQNKLLTEIMTKCHLEKLIPRLKETAAWAEQLSPGEQQRIAFARVLLQKPDWVFFDESTSMLDLDNEAYLYNLINTELPHCTIVSVGHRPSLNQFHDHVIDIAAYSLNAH